MSDVDHVAINQDSRANLGHKLIYLAASRPDLGLVASKLRARRARSGIAELLAELDPQTRLRAPVHHIEHHMAHLASAFLVSPFRDAVVVSVDGFGDFASAAWGVGRGDRLSLDGRVYFPHSLGVFYEALTQYLGFPNYGDEYKVMGLAPYGEPRFMAEMRQILRLTPDGLHQLDLSFFIHHRSKIAYQWSGGSPGVADLFSLKLEELLGPRRIGDQPLDQRHRDIARSVQGMYEEAFFHLLNQLHQRYQLPDVALAGGCAANSVANGKISRQTPFQRVYVQAAPGDAGGAIGAAFALSQELGVARSFVMDHAFWGPAGDADGVEHDLGARQGELAEAGATIQKFASQSTLCRRVAGLIADGAVVGWFQGRMEWGPRALGNRCILCDPRREDIRQILNAKIKRRESFRPFAPSILRECTAEWFEEEADVPFMMQVFQVRPEKRHLIPAVTHVDGSGRLQTVDRAANVRYHELIGAFRVLTGIPMVLNTSFIENEPIVCSPGEALDCFLRTKMDALVLNDTVICRDDAAKPRAESTVGAVTA